MEMTHSTEDPNDQTYSLGRVLGVAGILFGILVSGVVVGNLLAELVIR